MPPTWLNLYTSDAGVWQPGQDDWVEIGTDQAISPPGATVRLYETSRSGYITLSPTGGQIAVGGDAEVFIRIDFTNNTYQYLSAPLTRAVDVANVAKLRLAIIAPRGPVGQTGPVTEVRYRVFVNAHLVYEVLP
jgi:hypothetical protein